ncbi:serine/arginine repetitive matrix protein 1-like [Tachyglossus aculeatus]|uniref:serine/arginine repetitive matrix protein 1-like n=1 Tax=Tachyglossus aculeatus TaxID=9261 RepID=UPI0018F5B286|nr:serine/arginine repetitive matrix protein 1-like [Tachyglossus aculeatus]
MCVRVCFHRHVRTRVGACARRARGEEEGSTCRRPAGPPKLGIPRHWGFRRHVRTRVFPSPRARMCRGACPPSERRRGRVHVPTPRRPPETGKPPTLGFPSPRARACVSIATCAHVSGRVPAEREEKRKGPRANAPPRHPCPPYPFSTVPIFRRPTGAAGRGGRLAVL